MPKTPIDYSKSVIYKICCKDPNVKEIYIGSTTNFIIRKNKHKYDCMNNKSIHYNAYVYRFMRDNGGWDNWDMVLIKKYSKCDSSLKLRKKEQKYCNKYNAKLNSINSYTNRKEYSKIYEKERRVMTAKRKEWPGKPYICECGSNITRHSKPRHERSQKHQNFINAI